LKGSATAKAKEGAADGIRAGKGATGATFEWDALYLETVVVLSACKRIEDL
jgi:hypothetical protein